MNLLLTEEQISLTELLQNSLHSKLSETQVWEVLTQKLDLTGVGIPESVGGAGGSLSDLAVVFTEIGRAVAVDPFLPHVTALRLLLALEENRTQPVSEFGGLPASMYRQALEGRIRLGVSLRPAQAEKMQFEDSGALSISAKIPNVLGGATSDAFVLPITFEDSTALVFIRRDNPGVSFVDLTDLDLLRPQCGLVLEQASAVILGSADRSRPVIDAVMQEAAIALAATQVGGASRALHEAVKYAKIRYQFGRPIGAFQAIKHQLAEQHHHVRSAEIALRRTAALVGGTDTPFASGSETQEMLSLLQSVASEVYIDAAHRSLQIHGGMGFTMEVDCHLHIRRAHASAALFGHPDLHRARLAKALLDNVVS